MENAQIIMGWESQNMTGETGQPRVTAIGADRQKSRARPYVIGIGGTTRANSSTEKALRVALAAAEAAGAETCLLGAEALDLPMYAPERPDRSEVALRLVEEVRRADGIILGSPGYHGGISGLVKNALDYVEDMSKDSSPYFQGRAVGLIATGAGWQGAVATLSALRTVVHSLRGWPTPLGVPINTIEPSFDADGECVSERLKGLLETMAREVVDFALHRGTAAHP
jgi:FMN reductase